MTRFGLRTGAATFALGLALCGPQAVGLAVADSPDGAEKSGPERPRASRSAPEHASAPRSGTTATRTPRVAPAAARNKPADPDLPKAAAPTRPAPSAAKFSRPDDKPSADSDPATWSAPAAIVTIPAPSATVPPAAAPVAPRAAATVARAERRAPAAPAMQRASAAVRFAQFLDSVGARLSSLPANPVSEFISGALLLVRRTLLSGVPTIPVLTVGNSLVPEGSAGDPQAAVFTVSLEYAYDDAVTVQYSTEDATATAGADYTPVSGVLVFAPGQTTQQVSVNMLPDGIAEADETFRLTLLSQAVGGLRSALLGSGSGVITNLPTAAPAITIAELDSSTSALAVRVDKTQQFADAIKVDADTTFTLTLPGPVSSYTVLANKPAFVDITGAGNQLTLTTTAPGFLGLSIQAKEGTASRYLGLYIADPVTHLVPDTVTGYLPVGSITSSNAAGDAFLQDFNFRDGVAPIDYLYIYDQGGADSTDGNLRGLLTQAVRHGLVPVVVFYNIQAVNNAAGGTGITEGWNSAYQAINDYNWSNSGQHDPNMFTGYMKRYFTKLAADFTAMNNVGIPVQVVVEPDFLGYMAANTPDFTPPTPFVPTPSDRTLNTAKVSSMYDAGLLTRGVDPAFPDTVAGLVQAINYYTATKMPNLRLGWKTNVWAVTGFQNQKMGLLHETDSMVYPWQNQWTAGVGWEEGRKTIIKGATNLGNFLDKVGATSWTGSPDRTPFLAIDKYGVDGAFLYDTGTQTAARGILSDFVRSAQTFCGDTCDKAMTQKYFGLDPAELRALKIGFDQAGNPFDPRFPAVLATLQNASVADPNIALWFVNADQWNNYLLLVKTLSTTLNGTKVMLWQIPQGHINGSTTLTGRDLPNSSADGCAPNAICGFEDSAASYFFGDTFTAPGGRLTHFGANQAGDAGVTVSGNTVTWGEHMTLSAESGALSVLFGAGLGVSTRGSVTPAGVITDGNFWSDKATAYLSGVVG